MNPHAAQFSPLQLAMVQYGGAVKPSGPDDRPHDLVVHESMKQLVHDMQELKARTESLERDNASLQRDNGQFKQELQAVKHQVASGSFAPAVQSNLTGYAASDVSSNDATASSNDTTVLEKKVLEHQDTVTQILEKFNETLDANREQITKDLDEAHYALKHVKGRTGALESNFKSMREDLDELEMTVQSIRNENGFMAATTNTSNTGLSVWMTDKIEKLESNVKNLEDDGDNRQTALNELRQKVMAANSGGAPMALTPESGNGSNVTQSGSADRKAIRNLNTPMAEQVQELVVARLAKREIDNAATRDALYELYHRYTRDIDNATDATLDELWDLRDWVVVRLTLFELYGKTLREAKSADCGL